MNKRKILLAATAPLLLAGTAITGGAQQPAASPRQPLQVDIDARQTARSVSPYEYGMFIEHIGELVYRSLWSEMLDDRKFYFPIQLEPAQAPASAPAGPFRGMQPRKWYTVGPKDAVTMDKAVPFVGEQSPRVALDAATPHGIRQSGFALVKGKRYTGHIWIRATEG